MLTFTGAGAPVGRAASAIARFSERVRDSDPGGCWVWSGALDRKGYARFRNEFGVKVFVHRFAYEKTFGPIAPGLTIDHLCRNRACCNPLHLEAVTSEENIRRGTQGQYQRLKTHCPAGHEYTAANTYTPPRSSERMCRACRQEAPIRHEATRSRKAKKC